MGGVRGVLLNRVCDDHLTRLMIDVGEHIETKRWAFNALLMRYASVASD